MDHLERLRTSLSGQYVIDRELGGGGMSRVYLAEEMRLHRRVVIKVVSPELAQGLSLERFEREIQLAASLNQANIVPVLSAADTDGVPYFTMPFVEGESLRHHLAQGPLPIADVVNVIRDVARALSYAHRHGVVHRDIKPDNVLLSAGAAVVTDFGIAKAISAARTQGDASNLTQTGMSIGTAAYMAPEQAAGDPHVDRRADIYSLGCMAYELLAGAPPFVRDNLQRVMAAQLTETPVPISEIRAGIPAPLAAVVMQCLNKDPDRRPQHAEDVARALDGVPVSGATAVLPLTRRGSRWPWVGVAAALVALAIFLIAKRPSTAVSHTLTQSLAVLPIENVGGDSAKEYLAEGMTSELASNLRQTPGLEVVGDLSTSRFKHTRLAPGDIAGQLHVSMLVSGTLQSDGNAIRLQMQLNDASGKLLWSKKFDREMKDNFALQDEVAAAIASEMRVALSPAARAGRTESPEAHDLFMHGEFEKNKVDSAGLARAAHYFQQALAIDPDYAKAHAGLGFAYDILADTYAPSHEYHTLALKQARLALAADSLLPEGRVLYGFELAAANWDFPHGMAEMNRGLALNPGSPDALFMVATFSFLSGNTKRAIGLADSLIQVDPLSPLGPHLRAEALLWDGQYAAALRQKIVAKKIDPSVVLIDVTEGNALRELGRLDESLAAFLDFKRVSDLPSYGLVMTYARMGRRDDALREIHAMETRARKQWVDPDFLAISYAAIGDRDTAIAMLDKAYLMKTYGIRLFLGWDMPWLRSMDSDPRYVALRQKVLATTWSE
jgi:serine/threonine-protein kinase